MKYRILIIEDDPVISEQTGKQLESWGYETRRITDFSDVMRGFAEYSPQLVLLDITLPFYNGFYWCREIRRVSKVPVIFISSASDNMNVVMAVNMGGDDFVAKPFDMDVLTAKVGAMLRRTYDFASAPGIMQIGSSVLSTADMSVTGKDGTHISLSKNEFRIAEVLARKKGSFVSRDELMMKLWETDSYVDDNTLTVNVTRLRRRLAEAGLPDIIKTKKGVGYMLSGE